MTRLAYNLLMKYIIWGLTIVALGAVIALVVIPAPGEIPAEQKPQTPETQAVGADVPRVEVIATGLEIPWDIAFLPNGSMLVTERTRHVIVITKDRSNKEIPIPDRR